MYILSFYPTGSKLSLCLLYTCYRQWFLRYGVIFKIAIFGHETWSLTKDPEVTHTYFLPQGGKIELILAIQAAVSKIQADFQNLPYT